ncbi:hypothetical protein [Rhodococcus sp. USK13]|uniref:hypothetical protein n=1 Tax=Rhodococcus sp. USK13 TaxID=2806442 RepID=UPI001BCD344F|nr:hypothetical protein [Rhodococcus sp. USK13]
MAETMTMTEPPKAREASRVAIEDDASPLVRLIGRILRDADRLGHARDELNRTAGTVVIRSHDTPQSATITFGSATVEVCSGVHVAPDATLVVDLHTRFSLVEEPTGDIALAAGVLSALQPPLPNWRDAAARFWEMTRGIPRIPDVLIVKVDGADGVERARFGEGTSEYLIAGPENVLAGVFSGADDFLESLAAGMRIRGTLSQMSVLMAASWKVRFDV